MIKNIAQQLHAIAATSYLILVSCLCFIPILFFGLIKLIPYKPLQSLCTRGVDAVSMLWCDNNNFYIDKILGLRTELSGLEHFNRKDWYLVIANHQSWLDIVILHRVFNRKIPVLKFFIKDQLKWIPLLGFSWWAMGCPFMKRYSKEYLAKHPEKKGKDILSTQKALSSFQKTPGAIMNFVEGTRFTLGKKDTQNSPYTHLLKPKAGGISFIISTMGQQLKNLLDVTIIYPQQKPTLWDFLCRRIKSVKVNVRCLPIPSQFTSSHSLNDSKIQADFKDWLNKHWLEKDHLIASLK